MKYEDLSFITKDEDENELINDIIAVVPNINNSEQPFIVYTDYTLEENDEFIKKFGKLMIENEKYYIETNLISEEIDYINKSLNDEIVKYVNDTIGENLYD